MNCYAGFWIRFAAYMIDYVLLVSLNYIVLTHLFKNPMIVSLSESMPIEKAILTANMLEFLYFAFFFIIYFSFMHARWQATLGKMVVKIKVMNADGSSNGFIKMFMREIVKSIGSIPLFMGYIIIFFNDEKQGWHDKLLKTHVVKNKKENQERQRDVA